VAYYKSAASRAQCGPSAAEVAFKLGCTSPPDASGDYACRCSCGLHKPGGRSPSLSVKAGVGAALVRLRVLPVRAGP
jgi:hypothetical protein